MDVTLRDARNTLTVASDTPTVMGSLTSVLQWQLANLAFFFPTFVYLLYVPGRRQSREHALYTHSAGSHMAVPSSSPLNCKAPKLQLLLIEWHNNYPSTQLANRISPSWRPQPIGYLDIWELICHSQRHPSHFFLSLKWVLLSSQVSEEGFIIPA